jgi:DNA primase
VSSERPDITDVLDHYDVVTGKRMVACPLHEDRTPSCSIQYDENLWKCHSCGEGGDSWSLIMQKEGLDFAGAKEWVEKNLGLTLGPAGPALREAGSVYGRRHEVKAARSGGYVPSWRR